MTTSFTLSGAIEYYRKGDWSRAEQLLLCVLEGGLKAPPTVVCLGVTFLAYADDQPVIRRSGFPATIDPLSAVVLEKFENVLARFGAGADVGSTVPPLPDYPAKLVRLGIALCGLGLYSGTAANFDAALAIEDASIDHFRQGNALAEMGRFYEALSRFDLAIAGNPRFADAHLNRGTALANLTLFDEALVSYDRALALRPRFPEAHYNRGMALARLGRPQEGLSAIDQALALRPDYIDAFNEKGSILQQLGEWEAAIACHDRAIMLAPDHPLAHNNRGNALHLAGQLDRAIADYDHAIALKPDYAWARLNKSVALLARGDFATGWAEFEYRLKNPADRERNAAFVQMVRDGRLSGRTVLLEAEQGYGDALQFCRYATMVAGAGALVVLRVRHPLLRLLSRLNGPTRVIPQEWHAPELELGCGLLSLPLAFDTTLQTIPCDVPYLRAEPEAVERWRERLDGFGGLRVGLVWSGDPRAWNAGAHAIDGRRSITLDHFAPLAEIPGLLLISLQKGERAGQARTPPRGMAIHDWTAELDDFADTAALIEALDLVISVDTSVAHLAGALAKPVWLLSRFDACWRWMRDRDDSPWYPTMRIFRQPRPGDWGSVMRHVTAALRRHVGLS